MAANKPIRFGPAYLASSATNVIVVPTLSGGTGLGDTNSNCYLIIKHVRLVNKTAGAVTASLYIGLTGGSAGGTEFMVNATSIAANSYVDWYGALRLEPADFLSGLAGAGSSITFQGEGEIGVV